MKRIWLAGLLALVLGSASQAGNRINGQTFGMRFTWPLKCFPGIHQHGPLYNYTPGQGEGYQWMQFHWHQLRNYQPAHNIPFDPSMLNRGCGGNGCGNGGCGAGLGSHFAGLFGFWNHNSCSAGTCYKGWTGWFGNHSCGNNLWNLFSGCGVKGCSSGAVSTPAGGCNSCSSSIQQTAYYETIYSPLLAPAWTPSK